MDLPCPAVLNITSYMVHGIGYSKRLKKLLGRLCNFNIKRNIIDLNWIRAWQYFIYIYFSHCNFLYKQLFLLCFLVFCLIFFDLLFEVNKILNVTIWKSGFMDNLPRDLYTKYNLTIYRHRHITWPTTQPFFKKNNETLLYTWYQLSCFLYMKMLLHQATCGVYMILAYL